MININSVSSSDTMDVLSTVRAPVKPQKGTTDTSQTTKGNETVLADKTAKVAAADQEKLLKSGNKLKKEEEKAPESSREELEKMASELNDYMDDLQTSLGFSVNKDDDNKVVFQIKNRDTNEVIRQIPAEEVQVIKDKMTELTGMLLDQHA